jgi:hypothetical protein
MNDNRCDFACLLLALLAAAAAVVAIAAVERLHNTTI